MSNKEYKTTFNYLLTHRIIPQFYFNNLDYFYDTIVTSPDYVQSFLKEACQRAVSVAESNADIEPAWQIDKFDVSLGGPNDANKFIMVSFQKFEEAADCAAVAFPVYREYARYFTCELSSNPLTGESFLIAGEWSPGKEETAAGREISLNHINYGEIEPATPRGFANRIAEIAYGWDKNEQSDEVAYSAGATPGDETPMTDEDFNDWINNCINEFNERQTKLIKDFNLTAYDAFWISQETETIQFKNDGKVELEFTIIPIGSWSSESNSWMWAWANDSNTEELRQKAAKIKELADSTGYDIFEVEAFEADEYLAHKLTAIAALHLNAMGMYIAPFEKLKSFYALFEPKVKKQP